MRVMPLNFYAEISFTEMFEHEYFGIRVRRNTVRIHVRSCPTTDVRGWLVSSLSGSNANNVLCSVLY